MRKKIILILSIIVLIAAGGYIYIRYHFLNSKDFKPDTSKEKNIIDLRPSVIAKLQQLVKDGSKGLYKLSVGAIDPGALSSTLDVVNAGITVDTAVMVQLDYLKELPDDIVTIHFDSLHINGIGIADLLNTSHIDIKNISINRPLIKVYHKSRVYNDARRKQQDSLSLYKRIKEYVNRISIDNIIVTNGTFINTELEHKKTVNRFNDITISINDLLVDSSTQFDTNRFLFAKHATIEAKNYIVPTADSLYYFKTGSISLSAEQHTIHLLNVELSPRGNRKQFESKLQYRTNMYHIVLPEVTLYNTDWQALMNHEKFIMKKALVPEGTFSIYFDKTLPKPPIEYNNFPQQLLMKVDIPVSVNELSMQHINVAFEEYNPDARASGVAFFDFVKSRFTNVSNIPSEINKRPIATFTGSGLFMHHIPFNAHLTFNLAKYKTGEFTADIHMDTLDNATINPLAEPLGLFSVKSGQMQQGTAHMKGTDSGSNASIALSYRDLHIKPLKKANESGELKKQHIRGFIANVFLVKNANPLRGNDLRQPSYSVPRDHHMNFFSLVWVTVLTGILKTIGIPVNLVIH